MYQLCWLPARTPSTASTTQTWWKARRADLTTTMSLRRKQMSLSKVAVSTLLTSLLSFFQSQILNTHGHYHFSLVVFHRVSFGLDLPHITIQHVASRGMADRIRIDPARWKSGERKPRNDRPDGNGRWIKGLWYYNILCCTVSTQRSQVASLYLRVEPRHIHAFLPCNLYRHMKLVSPSPYQRR